MYPLTLTYDLAFLVLYYSLICGVTIPIIIVKLCATSYFTNKINVSIKKREYRDGIKRKETRQGWMDGWMDVAMVITLDAY